MDITSRDYFTLDGVSCETVGLYCDTPPIQVMGNRRIKNYTVGTDEDFITDDDSFEDITFKIVCYSFFPDSFDTTAIYDFLQNKRKLKLSRNGDFFYKVRNIACSPSSYADGNKLKFNITMKCAPFRYIDNEALTIISGSGVVVNNGTRYSRPIYTLLLGATVGTGDFLVNGQSFSFELPSGLSIPNYKMIIDAENEAVYTTAGANLMPYTTGEIQYLNVGNNSVSMSGIIQNVSIQRNGRCY